MRLPSKPAWLLIGVHTICLGVGFWFLCKLVTSAAEHQAAEAAWIDLASRAQPLADFVAGLELADLQSGSPSHARLQSLVKELAGSDRTRVMLVNENLSLMARESRPLANDTNHWTVGDRVPWHADGPHVRTWGPQRGHVVTPDGNRLAVSYPISKANARLIAFESHEVVPPWRGTLLASLPLAAGIAFFWTWALSSVSTCLMSARLDSEELSRKAQSEHDALRSAQDLLRTRDAVIFGLAKLAESRDPETGHHLERISLYSTRLANALRMLPKYHRVVTPGFVRLLGISSVLHDIGKVGLEDTVLLKPGRLNDEERRKMQEHTLVAGECLKEIEHRLGESNFLQTAREIALYHHERWDGTGYPTGLTGEDIPLAARIVTVADVYDALASKRVYKDAFPHEECVRLIREGAGTQFDPELVNVFLSIEADFAAISRKFASNQAEADAAMFSPIRDPVRMSAAQEAVLRDAVLTGSKANLETAGRSSSVA